MARRLPRGDMDLGDLFTFGVSPLELMIRGTLMYWFLWFMFRFVLRRDASGVGIADILLVVLIADASQNAMSADYHSVAEGCVLAGTLMGWNYLIDWAGFRFEAIRKFVEPRPLLLIDSGRYLARNMRRELVTREELEGELRKEGIGSVAMVRRGYMESDGTFSFVCEKDKKGQQA